ncbi:hypothetical protein [Lacinutrix jangbogonensis]|uniref:hypothetical protein n=1 Tax=Lacinutrix jangbogonensis TaxID=1469557 RepID=UPI00068B1CAC|nr:hypothetical protein [Lacinutrix jangbogonensis]
MKQLTILLLTLFLLSCSNDDENSAVSNLLSEYIENQITETGAIIACASSNEDNTAILTFFYPKTNAINIRFYESETTEIEKLDYSKYSFKAISSEPFFNGYLRKFTTAELSEHWIIVTYELNNEIKISNPIRTKQISKPSVWNDAVTVNQTNALMPVFNWEANAVGDNAIYFQVLSKENNDFISGTYTYENNFKFYNTSNVILNITEGFPQLENNTNYNFTLMDVSIDNWVNLVSQVVFNTQ